MDWQVVFTSTPISFEAFLLPKMPVISYRKGFHIVLYIYISHLFIFIADERLYSRTKLNSYPIKSTNIAKWIEDMKGYIWSSCV